MTFSLVTRHGRCQTLAYSKNHCPWLGHPVGCEYPKSYKLSFRLGNGILFGIGNICCCYSQQVSGSRQRVLQLMLLVEVIMILVAWSRYHLRSEFQLFKISVICTVIHLLPHASTTLLVLIFHFMSINISGICTVPVLFLQCIRLNFAFCI